MDLLRRVRIAVGICALALLGLEQLPAAAPNEYSIKSVFLYNFCRFIDWPESAFPGPNESLVIGVIGDDPFGPLLDQAVRGESFHGHSIRIEHYRNVREIGRCQLLFVSASESSRTNEILA